MAGDTLIDAYLVELEVRLGRIPDRTSVVDEVADHLWEKVDRLVATGISRAEAQHRALSEFGDPEVVGRAFASHAHGGAAVPTTVSKGFGVVAAVGGGLWMVGGLVLLATFGSESDLAWWVFFSSFMAGFVGLLMLGAGVHARAGSPPLGWLGIALLATPFATMALEAELWWFISAAVAGMAVFLFGLGSREVLWPFATLVVLDAAAVAEVLGGLGGEPWFDALAAVLLAVNGAALFLAGRRLATEIAVDQPDDVAAA